MRLCTQAYKCHRSQRCDVKPIDTHCKTVAVMVSYDSVLHVCKVCGDEVCRKFFSEPNTSPHEVSRSWTTASFCGRFLKLVGMFLNEATIDSVLITTIEQFKDQSTTNCCIGETWRLRHNTNEDVKKTPAKMQSSTTHCMYTICIFVVNDYNKQIWKVKVENKNWISVAKVQSHIILSTWSN